MTSALAGVPSSASTPRSSRPRKRRAINAGPFVRMSLCGTVGQLFGHIDRAPAHVFREGRGAAEGRVGYAVVELVLPLGELVGDGIGNGLDRADPPVVFPARRRGSSSRESSEPSSCGRGYSLRGRRGLAARHRPRSRLARGRVDGRAPVARCTRSRPLGSLRSRRPPYDGSAGATSRRPETPVVPPSFVSFSTISTSAPPSWASGGGRHRGAARSDDDHVDLSIPAGGHVSDHAACSSSRWSAVDERLDGSPIGSRKDEDRV